MISLIHPQPLEASIADLGDKTVIGSVLKSAEWSGVPAGLKRGAFFSARVTSIRVLSAMKDRLLSVVKMERRRLADGGPGVYMNRAKFVAEMQQIAMDEGLHLQVLPEDKGTLRDITSVPRLEMIFDIQTQMATGFANWKMGQDPDILDAYPCQELVRVESRLKPRGGSPDARGVGEFWRVRWKQLGGEFYGDGRMIARKDDPIWKKLGRFGNPWPPFDFQSGIGVEDVSRDEAEELGVIAIDEAVEPQDAAFDSALEASTRGLTDDELRRLRAAFGDQVEISGDSIKWRAA